MQRFFNIFHNCCLLGLFTIANLIIFFKTNTHLSFYHSCTHDFQRAQRFLTASTPQKIHREHCGGRSRSQCKMIWGLLPLFPITYTVQWRRCGADGVSPHLPNNSAWRRVAKSSQEKKSCANRSSMAMSLECSSW